MLPLSDPDIRRRTRPVITLTLIALNVLVFLYELALGGLGREVFFLRFGLIPIELTQGISYSRLPLEDGGFADITTPIPTWATVFTSMFIHGSFMHILGNMAFLWVLGNSVEDRMGRLKFLVFYSIAGVAAAAAQVAVAPESQVPLVGASGAIAGVMGAYFVKFPYSRINVLFFFIIIFVLRVPAAFMLGLWVLVQFLNGVGSLGAPDVGGVAHWAHLGGFVAGAGIVALANLVRGQPIFGRRRRPRLFPPEDVW